MDTDVAVSTRLVGEPVGLPNGSWPVLSSVISIAGDNVISDSWGSTSPRLFLTYELLS